MKRRITLPFAAIAVSGLLLAGCSSNDSTTTNSAAASGGMDAVPAGCEAYAPYGQLDGAAVEVYSSITGVEADAMTTVFDKFNECTGAKVTFNGNKEFEAQLPVRVEGGTAPDLAVIPQPGLLQKMVGTGAVVAAPASVEANVDKWWGADWKTYGTVGTTFYAAPMLANVKGFIWYSPKEFAAQGYEVPATLDELWALTATMATNGGTGPNYKPWCIGFGSDAATGWPGTDWIEDLVLRVNGPEVYDSWVAGDTKFNSADIKKAFQAFGDVALNPDYVNGGLGDSASIISTTFQEGGLPILDSSCSLHHQASFYQAQWPEGTDVSPNGAVWAFMMPPNKAGDPPAVTGGGEFVAAFNDKTETAAVQTFMSSDTFANARVMLGGVISANKGLDVANVDNDLMKSAVETLQGDTTIFRFDGSDAMPAAVGAGSFWTGMNDYVSGKSLDTVLTDIDNAWPSAG